jgi:outer membrane protein
MNVPDQLSTMLSPSDVENNGSGYSVTDRSDSHLAKKNQYNLQTTQFEDLIDLPENILTAALSIRQPLFSQFKTLVGIKMARADQMVHLCKYEEDKNKVKRETIKQYYGVLLEQKRVKLQEERLALMEESHRLVKVNFSLAYAREIDTLQSYLQIVQARIDHKHAESKRRNASETLIMQCGIAETAEHFWVDGAFPEPVFFITVEEAIRQLHEKNARIRQFKGEDAIQEGWIKLAKAEYLPELYSGGTFGRIGQFSQLERLDDIRWGDDQRLYVGLNWTLFSGMKRKQTIERKRVERERLHIIQQLTAEELELELRKLYEKIMISKERLESMQLVISIAQKSHSIAKKDLQVGSGTAFDLKNAEFEYNKARLSHMEALYDFHTAVTDFKFLIGSLPL